MDLSHKIQRLLAAPDYHPLRRDDIARQLKLNADERKEFRRVLADLLAKGAVVRVRKERFVLPEEADLVVGRLSFNEKGFAFLIQDKPAAGAAPATAPADIYIAEEDTGVALHNDRVVVRRNRGPSRARGRLADKPSGRVIRILERAHDTLVGTLQKTPRFYYVIPDETRIIHDIYTQPALNAQVGDKVVVKLVTWENRHVNPEGEIIEVLGKSTAPGVDILAIIRKFHLPVHFPERVLHEAEQLPAAIPASEFKRRRDLRREFIITIDPDDAKDFDDAVQVDELADGGWRLGVHIADVSHYVTPGSQLDHEASARGNSTYLVDRVLPMLPERISNNLCSLRPREDRLVQSCFIEFDSKLQVRQTEFDLSVIHSQHRLTYKEAFARLQSATDHDELTNQLKKMWRLAARLREQRFAQGALALEFPETKVRLDAAGRPVRIEKVENDISHQLIEEFMLAANEAAARQTATRQIPCIYRIHEDPDLEKLTDFRAYAQGFGYKVGDVTHRRELQKLLDHVAGKPEQYAIQLALLRSLKRACYSPQPVGHYGLAKKFYLHFTSPIRRYADLVAHRTLLGLIEGKHPAKSGRAKAHSLEELTKISEHISRTERVSDEAEKESVELKKIEYFDHQLTTGQLVTMDAVVCTVRNFGIFVELLDSLVQGLVHVSTLDDDFYHYEEDRERLVGKRTRRVIEIGQKLKVQVARVDVFKRQIDFRVVELPPPSATTARAPAAAVPAPARRPEQRPPPQQPPKRSSHRSGRQPQGRRRRR